MSQLLQAVQDQAEEGEFDDLNDIMGELGGRPQELFWKEDTDGRLLVGDDRFQPSVLARVKLIEGELVAERAELSEVRWSSPFLSEPESAVRDRQFD